MYAFMLTGIYCLYCVFAIVYLVYSVMMELLDVIINYWVRQGNCKMSLSSLATS